jgi:hypothetical protein
LAEIGFARDELFCPFFDLFFIKDAFPGHRIDAALAVVVQLQKVQIQGHWGTL